MKVIVARKRCSILEAVYWYYATPKDGISPETVLANMVHAYHLRLRGIDIAMAPCNAHGRYRIGNTVWVKTPHNKCKDKFRMGRVTEIISSQSVRVDSVPHHVKDLRSVVGSQPSSVLYLKTPTTAQQTRVRPRFARQKMPAPMEIQYCNQFHHSLLWPEVLVPVRVIFMGQIALFNNYSIRSCAKTTLKKQLQKKI